MSDYLRFLEEIGVTPDQMEKLRAELNKSIPPPTEQIAFLPSPIHGTGVFSQIFFTESQRIMDGMISKAWTPMGMFVNHAKDGNLTAVPKTGGFDFVAKKTISPGEEMTIDYRAVVEALTGGGK